MVIANPVNLFLMFIFLGLVFTVFECEVGGEPVYYQTEEKALERELARQEHKEKLMDNWFFKTLGKSIENGCAKEKHKDKEVCIQVRSNDGVYKLE